MKRVYMLALAGWFGALAWAEIAPEHYVAMQLSAPEALNIKAVEVNGGWCFFCSSQDVVVEAQVIDVERSASGLKVGQSIEIRYTHRDPDPAVAGPRPIPLLKSGSQYPAYLKASEDGTHYLPAARGASFEPIAASPVKPTTPIPTTDENNAEEAQ